MYGSKFHRKYGHLLSAPGITIPTSQITPRSIAPTGPAPTVPAPRPRFNINPDSGTPVKMPVPGGGKISFWDKETFGIENRYAVPAGAVLTLAAIYALNR